MIDLGPVEPAMFHAEDVRPDASVPDAEQPATRTDSRHRQASLLTRGHVTIAPRWPTRCRQTPCAIRTPASRYLDCSARWRSCLAVRRVCRRVFSYLVEERTSRYRASASALGARRASVRCRAVRLDTAPALLAGLDRRPPFSHLRGQDAFAPFFHWLSPLDPDGVRRHGGGCSRSPAVAATNNPGAARRLTGRSRSSALRHE
jgi:hypothetical protein